MTIHERPSMSLLHLSTHLSHYPAAAMHESSPDMGVGTSPTHLRAFRKVVHEPQKSENHSMVVATSLPDTLQRDHLEIPYPKSINHARNTA